MTWASERRFAIFIILAAVLGALITVTLIAVLYETPSCKDGKQNQGEAGADCGGPCEFLCTSEQAPPTVLYTQIVNSGVGRASVIAKVENKNAGAAAEGATYTIRLYDAGLTLLGRVEGTLDLPPGGTVPIFVANIDTGQRLATRAFLEVTEVAWRALERDPRALPKVTNILLSDAETAPRVAATLANSGAAPLANIPVVVVVHGQDGTVIGASSTLVQAIPAFGSAKALFTWPAPFKAAPYSFEVLPNPPLPRSP